MKGFIILVALFFVTSLIAFEGLQDGTSLKIFNRINCSTGMTCTRGANGLFTMVADGTFTGDVAGDGGDELYGFRSYQETATAETLAAVDCMKTYITGGTVEVELPEASTVTGCRYTFVVGLEGGLLTVDPDDADQILTETNAVGDSITSETLGNSIIIEAISDSQWAVLSHEGTWTDAD